METITALDLYAGTGWGVACKRLGIDEKGVEIMPEAVATRAANGMATIYRDVWDGLLLSALDHEMAYGCYDLLIASPPCQTFSAAGNGAGRRALNEVITAIDDHIYKDPGRLREFGEAHDPRTALVLSPLAYIYRDRPRLVALEQVPTVLPVWEAYARVMRGWGYDVKTEILYAEQYGVPQTRRRAILVARLDGPVALPTPTHSRYYVRKPDKLDPGVLKWVSMAEALGWGADNQPSHTITAGTHGPSDRWASGGHTVRAKMDALVGGPNWVPRSGGVAAAAEDPRTTYTDRFDVDDAAALQTFPTRILQNGNQPNATRRRADHPAPTICFGHNSTRIEWVTPEQAENVESSGDRLTVEQAAALQSYPTLLRSNYGTCGNAQDRGERRTDQPAATVTTKVGRNYWDTGDTVTVAQASALQTFPEAPFIWCGPKTKQFLQIGNAVPPLLAEHILAALITPPVPAEDTDTPFLW